MGKITLIGHIRALPRKRLLLVLGVFFMMQVCGNAWAEEDYAPARSGISLNAGYTYDPSQDDIRFLQVSMFKLYDYSAVWKHKAPDNLKFKVEGALGSAFLDNNKARLIANAGIMALLYLDKLESKTLRPFLEAGIGVIYTDYRVTGQDYRFNFNPQAGIGVEFKPQDGPNCFMTMRAHHVSNGGIGSSNRGMNSVVLMFGRFF